MSDSVSRMRVREEFFFSFLPQARDDDGEASSYLERKPRYSPRGLKDEF